MYNHDEAEKTLAELINLRLSLWDKKGKVRFRPLYKILPPVKAFEATDHKDQIFGVLGIASPTVHQHVQIDYQKSAAQVYRDAMTYMLGQEREEDGVIDMYLEYSLSLSLETPIPELPSWVPDFSKNRPFMRRPNDNTWYWQYHHNSGSGGHTPLIRRQHGRHRVNRDKVNRELISVDGGVLTVSGVLIDEVDQVGESKYFCYEEDIREYSERQMKSSVEDNGSEGQEIQTWLNGYHQQFNDHTVTEVTTRYANVHDFLETCLIQRNKTDTLYGVNELCHEKLQRAGREVDSESWLTFIWRDLLEGFPFLENVSEAEFDEQYFNVAGSETPITGMNWTLNAGRGKERPPGGLTGLRISMCLLFAPTRSFFTTATSGFYGIAALLEFKREINSFFCSLTSIRPSFCALPVATTRWWALV